MNYEVIVVGAGPSGASAARRCAEKGLRVALIEKHQRPGMKVCAGGLDNRIIKEFHIDTDVVQCRTQTYCLSASSGSTTAKEIESATVYRRDFDQHLADRAVDAGATLMVSTRCLRVLKDGEMVKGVIVKTSKGKEKLVAQIVIAADGFNSITAKSANLHPTYSPRDYGLTVQREVYVGSNVEKSTKHLFYGKDISGCGFGWIYPKSHSYTVGLGCLVSRLEKNQLAGNLEYLIHKHPIASKILSDITKKSKIQAACVPLKLSPKMFGNGILVVGDAAGQVSALGGNGIYYAMKAGFLAGDVVADAVAQDDVSRNTLQKYQKKWAMEFGDELGRQKRVLELVEPCYNLYMEAKILLDNHTTVRRILEKGRIPAKRILRLRWREFND